MQDRHEELRLAFFDTLKSLHRIKPGRFGSFAGLTPGETWALCAISMMNEREGSVSRPGRVAEFMHVTPSALSQTLKTLEEKGLVVRSRSGEDFRAVALELTEEGRRISDAVKGEMRKEAYELIDCIGIDDFASMVETARRCVECIEDMRVRKALAVKVQGGEGA